MYFLAYVDERQQLPECTCFAALEGHAYTPTASSAVVKQQV